MNVDLIELLTHPAFMLLMILGFDLIFGDPVYRFHPVRMIGILISWHEACLLYTSPSPRDYAASRMPSSA